MAARAGCPYSVLRKQRSGDRSVQLTLPNLDALAVLQAAGAARIVSCNTLAHPTNAIDVTTALAESVCTVTTDLERSP